MCIQITKEFVKTQIMIQKHWSAAQGSLFLTDSQVIGRSCYSLEHTVNFTEWIFFSLWLYALYPEITFLCVQLISVNL